MLEGALVSGAIGGAVSRAIGGSFVDGFSIAAAGYLFNEAAGHVRKWVNPTDGDVRGCDSEGCGNYGASRDGGHRKHMGTDYVSTAGQDVQAVTSGTVSIGHPYADDLSFTYVKITTDDGYVVRELYVQPAEGIENGTAVQAGDVIGTNQSLADRYPGITQHVHVDITHNGSFIDPTSVIH